MGSSRQTIDLGSEDDSVKKKTSEVEEDTASVQSVMMTHQSQEYNIFKKQ